MDIDDEYSRNTDVEAQEPLLDVKVDGKKVLEVLTSNYKSLFNALAEWREVTVGSLFDADPFQTTEGFFIEAKGTILKYKEFYSKNELEQPLRKVSFGSTAAEKHIYTTSVPIRQREALKALSDKDIYLTFTNLFYRDAENNLCSAPLVFLKVKVIESDGVFILKAKGDGPVFNDELIRRIKERFSIDLTYNRYAFDLYDYVSFVSGKVSNLLWGVDDTSYLADFEIMESNRIARTKELGQRCFSFKAVGALLSDSPMVDSGILEDDIPTNVDSKGLAVIALKSSAQHNAVYEKLLIKELRSGKKVLVVEGKEMYDRFIERYDLSALNNPYTPSSNSLSLYDAFNRIEKQDYNYREADAESYEKQLRLSNDFRLMEEEKAALKSPMGETLEEMIARIVELRPRVKHPLDIDLTDTYDREDFAKDLDFLNTLSNVEGLRSSIVSSNPFYGLETEKDEATYKSLMKTVEGICFDLLQFSDAVTDLNDNSHGFVKIHKLRDYDEYINYFELFARYDGFPLRYFEFDNDERLIGLLSGAKNAYSIAGSLKLSIENLTSAAFFTAATEETYIKALEKDRKAKRELKSFLKVRDKKSYRSLLTLLGNYYENEKHILSYFEELKETYSLDVKTIEDIIAVEAALSYIDDYTRFVKLYDNVDFNNEFVRELFNDADKHRTFSDVTLPRLEAMRYKIEAGLDRYREYNPHDYTDYTDITFEELQTEFANKRSGTYQEFSEYCDFSQKLKGASRHLKDFLNEYIDLEIPLTGFVDDYLYSLEIAVYNNYVRDKLAYNQWNDCACRLIAGLNEADYIFKRHELMAVVRSFKDKSAQNEVKHIREEIKSLTRTARILNSSFMSSRYHNTLTDYYPLTYVSAEDVFFYPGVKYDTVIVNNSAISQSKLINALALGHEAIVFQEGNAPFSRPIEVDLKHSSGGAIYDQLRPVFEKLFSYTNLSYELRVDMAYKNHIIPLALALPGSEEPSFVLLPDLIYLTDERFFESYTFSLPEYINNVLKVTPLFINTLELATAKDPSLYLRNIINGIMECKRHAVEKSGNDEIDLKSKNGNKQKYLKRLTDIYNTFISFPTQEEIDELLSKNQYEQVFNLVAPINSTKLMAYGNKFGQYVLDRVKAKTLVLRKDHFFIDPKMKVEVRKSLPAQRQMEDISIDEVLRAIYIYLSNFSYMTHEALSNELVHLFGAYADDPVFRSRMQRALVVLIGKGYVKNQKNRYSLA